MSLADIKKKLYKKEVEKDLAKHEESEYDPRVAGDERTKDSFTTVDAWEAKKVGMGKEGIKAVTLGLIIIVTIFIVLVGLIGAYKYKQSSFGEERVSITLSGPNEIKSGELITYEISYKNNNRAALQNSILSINFPENFQPEGNSSLIVDNPSSGRFSLGTIKGYSEGKVTFQGKAYSPKGSLIYLKAELSYKPSNFNSQFVVKHQLSINVLSFPVILEVLAPQKLANGDALDYLISYKNNSDLDFENMKLKVEYPEGFTFTRANPPASEGNNSWYIGHVSAHQEGKILINGKLEGLRNDFKVVRVDIGSSEGSFVSFNRESASTKIDTSPLVISQTVNGLADLKANANDLLRYVINYKNEGDIGLKDVIVTEKIESPALNYQTLRLDMKGAFDPETKTITWKASDFKNLASLEPGDEGTIEFSIKVSDVIPVKSARDKNYVISSIAKIDSPDIPTPIDSNKIIASNKIDLKLNSKMIVGVKGYYNDSAIKNSGPLPPVVGKETTYTVHWSAINVSNDLSTARVEMDLPTGVKYTGKKSPENYNLIYNERTNSLIWDIGNLPAGTGVITPAKEIAFQVVIKPAPNQIDTAVDLTGTSTFSGHDLFTEENLSVTSERITTSLREDPEARDKYKVVPET